MVLDDGKGASNFFKYSKKDIPNSPSPIPHSQTTNDKQQTTIKQNP